MSDISPYLPGILLAYAAFCLGIVSPGPNILAVIGTAMGSGRRSGMALALGVAIGSLCWALLTMAGLSALLEQYAAALTVIKIVGGVYLLWLASKAFRSAATAGDMNVPAVVEEGISDFRYFRRGLTIQMTNPKAALTWIAIISLGISESAPLWVGMTIVIGTFLLSVALHLTYAIAFSTPLMVRLYRKARRTIQSILGTFFAIAALKLLLSESR